MLLAAQLNTVMELLAVQLSMHHVTCCTAEHSHGVTGCTDERASCYLLHS